MKIFLKVKKGKDQKERRDNNPQTPKNLSRTFFDHNLVLVIFKPFPVASTIFDKIPVNFFTF